jgi:Tfp pilus assembly ATPase PilU
METSKGEGMVTMDNRLKELYEARKITYEEVARRVSSPAFLKQVRLSKSL